MDSVRFGRALGIGTRGAAKALVMAAEAAAAAKPSSGTKSSPRPANSPAPLAVKAVAGKAARTVDQLQHAQSGLLRGSKRFGQAAGGSFVRLAGVLWLEFTGVFFGLFVVFAGSNAWKLRGNLHETGTNNAAHQHLLWSLAMTALFGYFCASSFLRARRRERRGQTGKAGRLERP